MRKNIVIIGANSDIARECALIWAQQNHDLTLASRDLSELKEQETVLIKEGCNTVSSVALDVTDRNSMEEFLDKCFSQDKTIDLVLVAHGVLLKSDSQEAKEVQALEAFIDVNGVSTILIIRHLLNRFVHLKRGHIAVISSIAGDRSRPSNLEYGLSKQMVSFYMDGLRREAKESGIKLSLVKPGLIRTKMTAHLKEGMLFTSSQAAARSIVNGIDSNKFEFYVPSYWRIISIVLKLVPYKILSRLNI